MKNIICCILSLICFFVLSSKVLASEKYTTTFEDSFANLNGNTWNVNDADGGISFDNGLVLSSENSLQFPFIYSNFNIIPETGDYFVEVTFYYPEVTGWGVGFGLGNSAPTYGVNTFNDYDFLQFQLWQGNACGYILDTNTCDLNTICDLNRVQVFQEPISLSEHILRIEYRDNNFKILDNGVEIQSNFLLSTNRRPTVFWMGNFIKLSDGTTPLDWSDITIKNVKIGKIEDYESLDTILIPGLGASWDVGAILSGSEGTNWQIPSFVKAYDGIINSFINAGYSMDSPNQNLFVFPYDWRRPLSELADKLDVYIEKYVPVGEKVNLVGHSMGGLVARAYSKEHGTSRINQIVTVGSPNTGTAKAYGVWEGAMIWDDIWWGKLALEMTTHFGSISGESAVDTVQRLAPSFLDLLPTENFLKLGGVLQPWSKNAYLSAMNSDIAPINSLTTAMFSNEKNTDTFINVMAPTTDELANDLWIDGRPVTFEYSPGDGTVTETSAKGPFANILAGTGWHGELVTKVDNLQKIFDVLGIESTVSAGVYDDRRDVFVVALRSPGALKVCNLGLTLCNGALGVYDLDNKLFMLPGYSNEDLVVRVSEAGELGGYKLHLGNINESSVWEVIPGSLNTTGQTDFYNVQSNGQEISATLDNTPPNVPYGLRYVDSSENGIACGSSINRARGPVKTDWNDSVDSGSGLSHYEYVSFNPPGGWAWPSIDSGHVVTASEYGDTGYTPTEGTYGFMVRAIDKVGNKSAWSSITKTIDDSCKITFDFTPPIVNITSPLPGTYQPKTLPMLRFLATDNIDTNPEVVKSGYSKDIGTHSVTVTATDNAGNVGSAGVTYVIQAPPSEKDQCKKNGWKMHRLFHFRNQRDCENEIERHEWNRDYYPHLNIGDWYRERD
jgi:pimeloyl-ACP methyl ester carboxylesterase